MEENLISTPEFLAHLFELSLGIHGSFKFIHAVRGVKLIKKIYIYNNKTKFPITTFQENCISKK